jgi:hypothetical protein
MERYSLPSPETQRWVARRKFEIVEAIRNGHLSVEDACGRYNLTTDELVSWQVAYVRHGINGLRARRAQEYRRASIHTGRAMHPPP